MMRGVLEAGPIGLPGRKTTLRSRAPLAHDNDLL